MWISFFFQLSKAESICPAKTCQNSIKKTSRCLQLKESWSGVECTIYGAQAVSRCASPLTTIVATTSAAHRGTTHCGIFWSWPNSENTPEWNEWLSVCPTFIWEQLYLLLFFSWDLLSELRAEPLVSVDWRESEPWKKKRQQKEKQAELRGVGTTCAQNTVVRAKAVWLSPLFLT